MLLLALHMLLRDKAKYIGIVMGVTLASMVITQQGSIFVGLMSRTFAAITDCGGPDLHRSAHQWQCLPIRLDERGWWLLQQEIG
ncbi:MAG: hypothetical protein NTV94_02955 [Planctomycetota bacterium]|nr:hypothetical protein [Planctomycetota bacterium]